MIFAAGIGWDESVIADLIEIIKDVILAFGDAYNLALTIHVSDAQGGTGILSFGNAILSNKNPMWDAMRDIGVGLLPALLLSIEWMKQLTEFRIERIEDGIRFALKAVVAKMVVENAQNLAKGLYETFSPSSMVLDGGNSLQSLADAIGGTTLPAEGGILNINYMIFGFIMLIVMIALIFMLIKVLMQIIGIMIEITVLIFFSPMATATLIGSDTRSIGVHYIKNVITTTLQLSIIMVAFNLYEPISKVTDVIATSLQTSGAGMVGGIMAGIGPIITLSLWSTALTKATEITKTAFGG